MNGTYRRGSYNRPLWLKLLWSFAFALLVLLFLRWYGDSYLPAVHQQFAQLHHHAVHHAPRAVPQ